MEAAAGAGLAAAATPSAGEPAPLEARTAEVVESASVPATPALPAQAVAVVVPAPASSAPAPERAPESRPTSAVDAPRPERVVDLFEAAALPVKAPTVAPPPAAEPVQLVLPPDSGLVLVETSRDKFVPVTPEESPAEAPRARRQRPPRAEVAAEPLQMVETRKEPPSL
jgi:hypothetical protein